MKRFHSYHSLNYHIVYSTKYRLPMLDKKVWVKLRKNMQAKAEELDVILHIVNGYFDHVHMLVSLKPTISVATAIKHFKGYSSRSIPELFWQNGYYAFTIDRNAFGPIFHYIQNQWNHHENQTLEKEIDLLISP